MCKKGHVVSSETKKKISEFNIGKHHSEETKRKISESHKGKNNWTKGKHFIFSEEHKKNISIALTGKHLSENHKKNISMNSNPYWKGKHLPEEMKQKISITVKEYAINHQNGMQGKKHSKDTLNKISKALKGRVTWNKGKPFSKETIKKIKDARAFQKHNFTSSIELKIQGFLKALGMEYYTHHYIKIPHSYQVDIFVPSMNLVIECDGDYYHKYPTGTDVDKIRTSELLEKGFRVLRLWERDIRIMNLNEFQNKLEVIKQ